MALRMITRKSLPDNRSGRGGFSAWGRRVVGAPWVIIVGWIVLAVALAMTVVPLAKVVETQDVKILPPHAMVAAEQMAKDFNESAQNVLVIVLTDERGLGPRGEDIYRTLADTLRARAGDVTAVRDFATSPELRNLMLSTDGKAAYMAVSLRAQAASPESSEAYQRITEVAKQSTAGSTVTAHLTGQTAVVGDLSIVSGRDMHVIEIATALLVLVILLLIYRRPVTMLLPLITIGISVAAAQGVVSALTQIGLGVSALTIVLMTAMIVGAGTDYAVFIISRYHEYIRAGVDSDTAVQKALSSIGEVIAASAAAVAVTFLGMVFTRLPAFTSVGPALAISIAIAFLASITLLPALLVLAGRRGWIAPRGAHTNRFWKVLGIRIVRRPEAYLLTSLVALLVLGSFAFGMRQTYNDRLQLPATAESNQGYAAMAAHFSTSALLPEYVYIHSPEDLRTPRALADLEELAQRVSQVPDVAAVRGVTRPNGQQLDQTKVSYQAGEVGSKLDAASSQIATRRGDLDALSSGAGQLAESLAAIRDQVGQAGFSVNAVANTLTAVHRELVGPEMAQLVESIRVYARNVANDPSQIDSIVNSAPSILAVLNNPGCDADPGCVHGRASLEQLVAARDNGAPAGAQVLVAKVDRLNSLLQSAAAELQSGGVNSPAAVKEKIAQMQDGADQLAAGSRQLADGVRTLVDQTKQLGAGINEAAAALLAIKRDAVEPSMAGMYIPQQVLTTEDFKNVAKIFVSPDGHSVRYVVESKFDPFSSEAMDQVTTILATARGAQPNTSLADATISVVGTTPTYSAIRDYYNYDLRLIVIATLIVVFAILVVLLRAIVAPLYLIATVVIAFMSSLGLGVAVFQFLGHTDLYWNVPAIAFIVLVAVGADYNLLLITRIREESGNGIRTGIIRAVSSTGGVITSAGVIFAASMFGLLFGSISTMAQTGFIIGAGLLIDTFLVRTITVPALAALIGPANWWPSKAGNIS